MKIIFAFFFAAFFAGSAFAQDQSQSKPAQPQSPPQGWYQQSSSVSHTLRINYSKNRDSVWASEIFTTDGGNFWTAYPSGVDVVGFINSFGYGYSPKGNGWISITTNGGQSWNDDSTGFEFAGSFYFSTPHQGFCFETTNGDQRIARTIDGGKSWVVDTKDIVGQIAGFISFDSLHAIAAGTNYQDTNPPFTFGTGIFYTSDGGITWKFTQKTPTANSSLQPVLAFDSATVYFIGETRGIYKSTNRGYTLQDLPIKFAAESASATNVNNITGVGLSGDIYRTFDGVTWVKQNSGTTVDLYGVSFVDSTTGWAVGDAGTILHTTNAGYSWVKQQITINTLNPQTHPNPANSTLTLGFTLPIPQHVTIAILDLTGDQVLSPVSDVMETSGTQFLPIDVHALASGTYMLRIQTEKYRSVVKFTVVH